MNRRLFIQSVSLATTFFLFGVLLLSVEDAQTVCGVTFPVKFYQALSLLSFAMWLVFTISLIKQSIIERIGRWFEQPPTHALWRLCWSIFIAILWIALSLNFVSGIIVGASRLPSDWQSPIRLVGIIWYLIVSLILVIKSIGDLWHNHVWRIPRIEEIQSTVSRAKSCLVDLMKPTEREETEGCIVRCLDYMFSFLKIISPLELFRCISNKGRGFKNVERYVAGCVIFGLLVILVLFLLSHYNVAILADRYFIQIVCALFGLRLVEMLQASLNNAVFNPLRQGDYQPYGVVDKRRLLILSLVNFAELIIVFAIIAFLNREHFSPSFISPWDSLLYSASTVTLVGGLNKYTSFTSQLIWLSAIIFGFIYIVLILASAINYLPNFRTRTTSVND
jgi:hypothetical protein